MVLDKQAREEIRAVVASEIQDVLRGEMAQWWAESVLALSAGGTSVGSKPAASNQRMKKAIRPRKVGSIGQMQRPENKSSASAPSPMHSEAAQEDIDDSEMLDTTYLAGVAESLARTQLELSRELALNMSQLKELLNQAQEVSEQLLRRRPDGG